MTEKQTILWCHLESNFAIVLQLNIHRLIMKRSLTRSHRYICLQCYAGLLVVGEYNASCSMTLHAKKKRRIS